MNTHDYIYNLFPRLNFLFDNIENKFYYYVICNTEFSLNVGNIINRIILLLNKYNINNRIIYSKKEIFFHAICQNIYTSSTLNNVDKKIHKWDSDYELKYPNDKISIKEFSKIVNDNEKLIKKDVQLSYNFLIQSDRPNKYLREEFIILKAYVKLANIDTNTTIHLGKENERWDAKINDVLIEITQAIPKYEFLTRKHLAENMYSYKSFSLELRTKQQYDLDNFIDTILNTIENKHKKDYNDYRILIVGILAEYVYWDDYLLNHYVNIIKQKSEKGIFKEIFLSIDAEHFIKLF